MTPARVFGITVAVLIPLIGFEFGILTGLIVLNAYLKRSRRTMFTPIPLNNPFQVASDARAIAGKPDPIDLIYLRAFFKERDAELSDCEIATATYLAWYGSLIKTGVSFEVHLARIGATSCKMDAGLVDQFKREKEDELQGRRAYAAEQDREARNMQMLGGGLVSALVVGGAWLFYRRHTLRPAVDPDKADT